MDIIFQFIGSLFGYVLWIAYQLFNSYALAIILFTLLSKAVLFPASIKQQKSMAKNAKLQKQMAELKKKYANNREKLNEETQKLYQKEGASPYGSCLPSIVPMLIMLGVFYAVAYPLTNTLHLDANMVNNAKYALVAIPGIDVSPTAMYGGQIDIIKHFGSFETVQNCFANSNTSIEAIGNFCNSFDFAGLNLLTTPGSKGFSVYLIIPGLCFVTSVASQFIIQKLNGSGASGQGCMTVMLFALPLFSAYIAYTVPAAVGFYWIASTVFGFVQSLVMHYFFGPGMLTARGEAARVALLKQEEGRVRSLR